MRNRVDYVFLTIVVAILAMIVLTGCSSTSPISTETTHEDQQTAIFPHVIERAGHMDEDVRVNVEHLGCLCGKSWYQITTWPREDNIPPKFVFVRRTNNLPMYLRISRSIIIVEHLDNGEVIIDVYDDDTPRGKIE